LPLELDIFTKSNYVFYYVMRVRALVVCISADNGGRDSGGYGGGFR